MTGLRRRHLLAAGLGVAAVPLVACDQAEAPGPARGDGGGARIGDGPSTVRDVRDFGAVGDGKADDTAAIAAACATDGTPPVIYLPAGDYKVTAWPDLPDFAVVYGDGADATTVFCDTDTTLVSLRRRQRVRFSRLGFYLTGPRSTAIKLTECFRCSFDSVLIRGNHLSDNHPRYSAQRGVVLEENTGGTTFIDCDINNFGVGLETSCIQNYVSSSKFTSNRIGVLGTGNDHNAGLSLTNMEFVSDTDPGTTDRHILIDGAANNWWLTNVWFEGAEVAVTVGAAGKGGPAQFGMVNCKVAARTAGVELNHCRQPYLANIGFDPDPGSRPVELRIDPAGCPDGTAVNLVSGLADDLPPGMFPPAWQVIGRGRVHRPTLTGTTTAEARPGDVEILRAKAADGAVVASVLSDGAYVSDRPDAGLILRDVEGGYWRVTVSPTGELGSAPLGRDRPNR
ncbi:glycosyl hydrolase family 28-related protein [Nocardia takedensis]|uniref:glycosyl hydrolase family 28-related protein n=1 Tax=Nocardia takedensis TaxID=259390 RepID=UPI000318E59B|nr:glycosyl hydrolase family 28-related protein [Nocardia takedensis]